jgi:hypothetical protein
MQIIKRFYRRTATKLLQKRDSIAVVLLWLVIVLLFFLFHSPGAAYINTLLGKPPQQP